MWTLPYKENGADAMERNQRSRSSYHLQYSTNCIMSTRVLLERRKCLVRVVDAQSCCSIA
eukprot:scaffold97558_cov23-Cyclotella_meneghiniana.AAC.3